MALDRSQFKPTLLSTLQQEDEKIDNKIQTTKPERVELLKIKEGENRFRIYPAHPSENEGNPKSIVNLCGYWLQSYVDEKDDKGNVKNGRDGKPQRVLISRRVWDARVHGWDNQKNIAIKKDLVDEYIKYINVLASESCSSISEKNDFLKPVYGGGFGNKDMPGITARNSWTFYADQHIDDNKKFGRLEYSSKSVSMGIQKAAEQESSNQPMQTSLDCFTNPDEGRLLKVFYDKNNKDYKLVYSVLIDTAQETIIVNGKALKSLIQYPLTDEDLDIFISKVKPLETEFRKVFKLRDLELQIEGLKYFDEHHNYNAFQDDVFLDTVEEMYNFWESKEENQEAKPDLRTMNKVEVKNHVVANGIRIKPGITKEKMVEKVEATYEDDDESPFKEYEEQEVESKEPEVAQKPSQSSSDRISEMRRKMNK